MIRYIDHRQMGRGIHDWLDSHFHFSFADYYNPDNLQFGVLRVLNDDLVQPGTGFDAHPHRSMEIISYVVQGELTHTDSMGNERTLTRGQVQYMSAGTGVVHGEHNRGSKLLRFLQIWILPSQTRGLAPRYGDWLFGFEDRRDRWLPIASSEGNTNSEAPIRIHADINMYATVLDPGAELTFPVASGRQAYLVLIEGEAEVSGLKLQARDAAEIVEEDIHVRAGAGSDTGSEEAHLLVIEMAKA
jgi:redox-sensitive bicupin YhaK (pirin superfamily)